MGVEGHAARLKLKDGVLKMTWERRKREARKMRKSRRSLGFLDMDVAGKKTMAAESFPQIPQCKARYGRYGHMLCFSKCCASIRHHTKENVIVRWIITKVTEPSHGPHGRWRFMHQPALVYHEKS